MRKLGKMTRRNNSVTTEINGGTGPVDIEGNGQAQVSSGNTFLSTFQES